ncbi:hypothetical protein DL96DRAFT_1584894 [Flagelloscypha sp. PMI_526]|nr:hypothetical protein DL96DRAFT_1584894 [Flagelloscypha sp. PMI_526]
MSSQKVMASTPADAEKIYAKAAKAELARDYNSAFRHYINCAESYLYLSSADGLADKTKGDLKASAKKALERAEKIKSFVNSTRQANKNSPAASGSMPPPLRPVAIRHLSVEERARVIHRGSRINGLNFPKFSNSADKSPNIHQPSLSPEQVQESAVWREPKHPIIDLDLLPQEIVQQFVTDCSLCASMSVYTAHCNQFQRQNILAAQLGENSGIIHMKLLFNGAWRRVSTDNQLPFHPQEERLLCVSCNRGILWPSYVEKAFMKLMGGYNFSGSNSSIDLYILLGWIPEHLDMRSPNFQRETVWKRIVAQHAQGNCLVTLGTGRTVTQEWQGSVLLPAHNYAVVKVEEHGDSDRTMTILDSWVDTGERLTEARTLTISWDDIPNVFEGIYLSWDPSLWSKQLHFHGSWKKNNDSSVTTASTLRLNLNVSMLAIPRKEVRGQEREIWLLLTRHISDTSNTMEYISLEAGFEEQIDGKAIRSLNVGVPGKNSYTNSPHYLCKVLIPLYLTSGSLGINCCYDGMHENETGFSLSVYAPNGADISWNETTEELPYAQTINGALTIKNSGGNATYPTFMMNPQYHLKVHSDRTGQANSSRSAVVFSLQTSKEVPVHIIGTWSSKTGERVMQLSQTDIAFSSGSHVYGHARVATKLNPGEYTLIVSSFEPEQTGAFTLKCESQTLLEITPILQEGAEMYREVVEGEWTMETARGAPRFGKFWENPKVLLTLKESCEVKIRLQLSVPSSSTALNLSVFDDESRQLVKTTGPYDDAISGVVTETFALKAGKYLVVPSTYQPDVLGGFRMFCYSTLAGIGVEKL